MITALILHATITFLPSGGLAESTPKKSHVVASKRVVKTQETVDEGGSAPAEPDFWSNPNLSMTVLEVGERMIQDRELFQGSCWDFANTVYNRAGFTNSRRAVVFDRRRAGDWADLDLLEPGDWVMIINTQFRNSEHSTIFVEWIDKENGIARTLNYVGQNRRVVPAYSSHSLMKTYQIIRGR